MLLLLLALLYGGARLAQLLGPVGVAVALAGAVLLYCLVLYAILRLR